MAVGFGLLAMMTGASEVPGSQGPLQYKVTGTMQRDRIVIVNVTISNLSSGLSDGAFCGDFRLINGEHNLYHAVNGLDDRYRTGEIAPSGHGELMCIFKVPRETAIADYRLLLVNPDDGTISQRFQLGM